MTFPPPLGPRSRPGLEGCTKFGNRLCFKIDLGSEFSTGCCKGPGCGTKLDAALIILPELMLRWPEAEPVLETWNISWIKTWNRARKKTWNKTWNWARHIPVMTWTRARTWNKTWDRAILNDIFHQKVNTTNDGTKAVITITFIYLQKSEGSLVENTQLWKHGNLFSLKRYTILVLCIINAMLTKNQQDLINLGIQNDRT